MDTKELITQAQDYIFESSKHAARVFRLLKFKHEFFEGTEISMSAKLCEGAYQELIADLVQRKVMVGQKYGLFAVVMPIKSERGAGYTLQLGITFPGPVSDAADIEIVS